MFYKPNNVDQSQTNFFSLLRIRKKFRMAKSDPGTCYDGWGQVYNMFYKPNNVERSQTDFFFSVEDPVEI